MAREDPHGAPAARGRIAARVPVHARPRLVLDPLLDPGQASSGRGSPVPLAWSHPPKVRHADAPCSDASDTSDEPLRNADRHSSSGIFELESDTAGASGSDTDEPSTPLHTSHRSTSLAPSRMRTPSTGHTGRWGRSDSGAWGAASPPVWQGSSGARSFRNPLQSTMPSFSSPLALAPTLPGDDPAAHRPRRSPDVSATRHASAGTHNTLRHRVHAHRAPHHSFSLPRSHSARRVTPPSSMGPPAVPRSVHGPRARALHRRAHSATGTGNERPLSSSYVGGVDGVDPQLVAAIGHARSEGPDPPAPELALSPPPSDLAHRLETLYLDSPVASPGMRLQRAPRSVVKASDLVPRARARSRRASPLPSPLPSPTEGAYSQPVLGLGLGLPGFDTRRAHTMDEEDTALESSTDATRVRRDACVVALARAYKTRWWRPRHAVWPDWADARRTRCESRTLQHARAHWAEVRAEISRMNRSVPPYARLASGMRVVGSVPSLGALGAPEPVATHPARMDKHDVFGVQRGVGDVPAPRGTRVTSDRMSSAPRRRAVGVRRQNTTMSVDDTVAAQRQQLWSELVQAKSACDAELDKILTAMLVYTEDVACVEEHAPDTTVVDAEEAALAATDLPRASDAALAPLQTMAALATELRSMSLHALLARPGLCRPYIATIQGLSGVWDEHPEWHGRGWYVELLLAVAGLSRVLAWWDAEHRFWSEEPRAPSRTAACSPHGTGAHAKGGNETLPVASPPLHGTPDAPSPKAASPARSVAPAPPARTAAGAPANMLMELSLNEERIMYLSPTWQQVVGTNPQALVDVPIASLLSPRSAGIFSRATRQLRELSWHTVEIVCEMAHLPDATPLPLLFEAQGMLVHHHATHEPSHTMWVMRLATADANERAMQHPRLNAHLGYLPADRAALNTELLLCRICEREIPAWFFEKHSEICHEIHRLEMDIGAANETLLELTESARALLTRLDNDHAWAAHAPASPEAAHSASPAAYRGQALALPPRSAHPPSALEGAAHALPMERASRAHAVKLATHVVSEVLTMLDTAMAITTPAIRDEAPDLFGGLLSPRSEQGVQRVQAWRPAVLPDAALASLVRDAEAACRSKMHAVNRMRNTIVYVETVRMESEQRVTELLEPSEAPPVTVNDSPAELEEMGTMSGLLFDPVDETPDSEDDASSATHATSPTGARSPIPIPNTRHTLRTYAHTPPLSPRAAPDSRFLSIASPRLSVTPSSPSLVPPAQPKATAASIKDFELLKPISKGAYGSVFLARKRATGDLFAIKVLKKSDMIAKNQITNVRAERMILMNRTQSPFVVKLFFTFQSTEYLYLVMEYLPGGDCASLVKALGELPEAWAQQYLAEIVHGLDYLHSTGVVHRDMKPDNLLIDQRGHLKLTDFGLSKFGLLGRQKRARNEPTAPIPTTWAQLPEGSGTPSAEPVPLAGISSMHPTEAYLGSLAQDTEPKRVVGTPDYLAPETILGVGIDEFGVDWWSVGVILFEFLLGYPPFHASTPDEVFDKILARNIDWDTDVCLSDEARDLIERLICTDRRTRLGANGVEEIKSHPFFAGIDWAHLMDSDGPFVPRLDDVASTDYFDARGAVPQTFDEEPHATSVVPTSATSTRHSNSSGSLAPTNEFGSFSYKNLPVLKQANDEMVRRIRTESAGHTSSPSSAGSMAPIPARPVHRRALSDLPHSLQRGSAVSEAPTSPQPSSIHSHSSTPFAPLEAASSGAPLPVLVADFNPVSRQALQTALEHAGAHPTLVEDGAEMCRLAMGETPYAVLFVKLNLRVVNGQDVARMIKSTRNINAHTPIVALVLPPDAMDPVGSVFDAVLPLPASYADLVSLLNSIREEHPPSPYVLSPALLGQEDDAASTLPMDKLAL